MTKQVKTFSVKFVEVLNARNAEQFSKDTVTAINNAESGARAIDALMGKPEFAEIGKTLLKNARIADAKQDKQNFIAVKVLVKIVAAMVALGQGLKSQFDGYSQTIIANLLALKDGVTNKDCLVALSKSITYDETEQAKHLVSRHNCTAGTASTQASSTRMMLLHLGIANVNKGKVKDITTMQDNERAVALVDLFAGKTK